MTAHKIQYQEITGNTVGRYRTTVERSGKCFVKTQLNSNLWKGTSMGIVSMFIVWGATYLILSSGLVS